MRTLWLSTLLLLLLLAACQNAPAAPPIPTRLPAAELPTEAPSQPTLPPTRDLTAPTPTSPPTAVPPTPLPTAAPAPVEARINLSSPDEGAQLLLGSSIVARGLAALNSTETVRLSLLSAAGAELASAPAAVNDVGWEASLQVPLFVGGAGTLRAAVVDADGAILAADSIPVLLALDAAASSQYLALTRPVQGETAVAGFFLYFEGRAQQPTGSAITVALWMDDCQVEVASFRITVGGSGGWQASLGVPGDVAGPACAVAYFGTPGDDTYRAVQIPVTIVAADDPDARGVQITAPQAGSSASAGQPLTVSGTAFNAARVDLSIVLENGRIVSEQSVQPDPFGAWELQFTLPFQIAGAAELTATAVAADGAATAETTILIVILDAPTPTPTS